MADHGVTEERIKQAFAEGDRVVFRGYPGTVFSVSVYVKLDAGHSLGVPSRKLEHAPVEGGVEGVECEWVLTWVPLEASDDGMILTDGDPVEVPLGEPWVLPGESTACGEFRLSTREAGPVGEVWDGSVPPGGYVCSTCGTPTESEPCPEHGLTLARMPADWRQQLAEAAELGGAVALLESWVVSGG